jgi:hypothetical protein
MQKVLHAVVTIAAASMAGLGLMAQEARPVPKDSSRITIVGCAKGTRFIVGRGPAHEPVRSGLEPGRRFRLNGKKDLIDEVKKQEGHMVEVTGLVRQADLAGPGGVTVGGARISGGPPQAGMPDARRNTGSLDPMIDVESFRPLAEGCSVR